MTYRPALLILLSSLTAFTPSCAGSSSEENGSNGDGGSSGDGDGDTGGDGDGDLGGDGDGDTAAGGFLGDGDGSCPPCVAPPGPNCTGSGPCGCGPYVCTGDGDLGTGGYESDGETACESSCTASSECGEFSDCVADCEEIATTCPVELDAYLSCANGATDIMCVPGVNLGISGSCLTEGTELQTCTASGDGDGDLGTGGVNGDGDLGTGGMACPPCAAPPADDCVGTGPCGCGPYTCPAEGICGDAVCENGDVCCNPLQGICAPPDIACIQ